MPVVRAHSAELVLFVRLVDPLLWAVSREWSGYFEVCKLGYLSRYVGSQFL